MLLLIDESGDGGVKHAHPRDAWFCLTGAVMRRECEVDLEAAFGRLKVAYGSHEFHFAHDDNRRREAVFAAISPLAFSYYGVACNKRLLKQKDWKQTHSLYKELLGRLLKAIPMVDERIEIRFDTLGGRGADTKIINFIRAFVRARVAAHTKITINPMESVKSPTGCGSIADYICGAYARSLSKPEDENQFLHYIKAKQVESQIWPMEDHRK